MSDVKDETTTATATPDAINPFARFIGGQMQVNKSERPMVCMEIKGIERRIDDESGEDILEVTGVRAWRLRTEWGPSNSLIYQVTSYADSSDGTSLLGECELDPMLGRGPFSAKLLPPGHAQTWTMPTCTGDLEQTLTDWMGMNVDVGSHYDREAGTLTIDIVMHEGDWMHLKEPLVFTTHWPEVTAFSIKYIQKLETGGYRVIGSMKPQDHGRRSVTGIGATIQEAIDNCG